MISGTAFFTSLVLLVTAVPLLGAWSQDFDAARKIAAEKKKNLYVVFMSTDSSGACQQLEKRIFSSEKFQSLTEKKFLLVKVDLPLKQKLQKENHGRLLELAKKFGVGGAFPTAFYLDDQGRPYHQETGVIPGGPEEYARHVLETLEKKGDREKVLSDSSQLSGIEKAQALVRILEPLPDQVVLNFYAKEMDELAQLDPEDTLKFRKEKVMNQAYTEFENSVKDVFHKDSYDKVVSLADAFLEKHQPVGELRQKVLFRKLAALNHDGQVEPAIKVANEIIAIEKGSSHGRFAAQIKAKLQKRLGQ